VGMVCLKLAPQGLSAGGVCTMRGVLDVLNSDPQPQKHFVVALSCVPVDWSAANNDRFVEMLRCYQHDGPSRDRRARICGQIR
jgi:hypothetical protein